MTPYTHTNIRKMTLFIMRKNRNIYYFHRTYYLYPRSIMFSTTFYFIFFVWFDEFCLFFSIALFKKCMRIDDTSDVTKGRKIALQWKIRWYMFHRSNHPQKHCPKKLQKNRNYYDVFNWTRFRFFLKMYIYLLPIYNHAF